MGLKVTLENPAYPKGTELSVQGLGLFVNGKTREVKAEEEERYYSETGKTVREALEGDESYKVEGTSSIKTSGGDN